MHCKHFHSVILFSCAISSRSQYAATAKQFGEVWLKGCDSALQKEGQGGFSPSPRSRSSVVIPSGSSAPGAGRKVVVPKLVDEAEDLTEVIPPSTTNSSQYLVEEADDFVVDSAASLVQMLRMERAEALPLCAFSQPSTFGASQVGAESIEYVTMFCSLGICVSYVIISSYHTYIPGGVPSVSVEKFQRQRKAIGAAARATSHRQYPFRCQWQNNS